MTVYQGLSCYFNVNLVGIRGYDGGQLQTIEINENFTAYLVPMSKEFCDLLLGEQEKAKGYLHDILLTNKYNLIPELTSLCRGLRLSTDVYVSSHPYFFKMLLECCRGQVLVYEAHNVDYDLKKTYFPEKNAHSKKYLELVKEVEELACRKADFIIAVSEADSRQLCRAYNVADEKLVLVPNGIEVFSCEFRGARSMGNDAVFVGSAHGPNIEAVNFIVSDLAPRNERITYTIIGNIREAFLGRELPRNVQFAGVVNEELKRTLYQKAAVALNPMFSGGGTNLKIFDYASYGIPIVSTPFGMRGLEVLDECVWRATPDEFLTTIEKVMLLPDVEVLRKTLAAREVCETHFDKSAIVLNFVRRLTAHPALMNQRRRRKRIAIEGRVLHRNVTGTERYIAEILRNVVLMGDKEDYEFGLVNTSGYDTSGIDYRIPYVSLDPPVDLYHRTYQPNSHFEIVELLLAKRSVFTFLDLILCKYPGYFASKAAYDKFVLYMRLAFSFSDRIIAISESAKKDVMATFHVPERKIDVVYLGIDATRFRKLDAQEVRVFRREFSLPEKYVLYLGTDYPHKNLANLLIAFAQIMDRAELKDHFLVIAGNANYHAGPSHLENHLAAVRERVITLGHFPDDRIVHLYNAADIFVYPSLYEGFGLPVLEAFACELPVVCSNATSLPEVAGDAAYMVDATDAAQIASGILKVVASPALRQSLIERGRKRVQEFTWEKCAKETYEVYRRALGEPSTCNARADESVVALLGDVMESHVGPLSARSWQAPPPPQPVHHAPEPQSIFSPSFIVAKLRQVRSIRDLRRLLVSAVARLSAGRHNG